METAGTNEKNNISKLLSILMGKIQVAQQITFFFHLIVFVSFHLIPISPCYYFFFLSSIFLRSRLANLFCNMPCCAVRPAADAVQHSTACIWKNDKTVPKNCSLLLLGCWITGALLIIDHHNMDDVFRNNITELDWEFEQEAALLLKKGQFPWLCPSKPLLPLISEMHKLLFDKLSYLFFFLPSIIVKSAMCNQN